MLNMCYGYDCKDESSDIAEVRREYVFGYRILDKDGKIVDENSIVDSECYMIQVATGFVDKNGNRLYVGDVVMLDNGYKGVVVMRGKNKFAIDGERNEDYIYEDKCKWSLYELVGRLYDGKTVVHCYE